jgi:hypothetical protein
MELSLCMVVISVTINNQKKITDLDVKKQPKTFLSCLMQVRFMFHLLTCVNQMLSGLVQKLFTESLLNCCNRCSYFIIQIVHDYWKKSVGRGRISLGDCGGQEVGSTPPNLWTGYLRISSPPCWCKTAIRHVEKQHSVCHRYLGH